MKSTACSRRSTYQKLTEYYHDHKDSLDEEGRKALTDALLILEDSIEYACLMERLEIEVGFNYISGYIDLNNSNNFPKITSILDTLHEYASRVNYANLY